MFSKWNKKRERERNGSSDGSLQSPTLLDSPISELSTTSQGSRTIQLDDNQTTPQSTTEREPPSYPVSQQQGKPSTSSPQQQNKNPQNQQQNSSSGTTNTTDIGYYTEESSSSLVDPHRPRGGSTASSVSSYHTAVSTQEPTSTTTSSTGSEVSEAMRSLAQNLQKTMKRLLEESMDKLEGRMETFEKKIETRVDKMEDQMKQIMVSKGVGQEEREEERVRRKAVSFAVGNNEEEEQVDDKDGPYSQLSTLREVDEDDAGKTEEQKNNYPKSEMDSKMEKSSTTEDSTAQYRRYTDTEATKLERFKAALVKRKRFSQNKSQSLKETRLPQKQCSQKVLVWLTTEIKRWKFVARRLDLSESIISTIISDNPNDNREQCYQMFVQWKSKSPENFNYLVLGEALKLESLELFQKYVYEVQKTESDIYLHIHE